MKWIRFCSAVVATLGLTTVAQADLMNLFDGLKIGSGHGKSCGCASSCQPEYCKPTITRPCDTNIHTYQRKISDIKPPCCDTCSAPAKCCAPALKFFSRKKCCGPANSCCETKCCETKCCDADPCEIAKLIYQSQTACFASDRKKACDKLGNYDCGCNPEVLTALVHALNDASVKVRKEAADEIGDLLRKNPCCCSKEVVAALTCALKDCAKCVRRQAEEALEVCGYEIIDGCCSGNTCCSSCGNGAPASTSEPKDEEMEPAPAPTPPEGSTAYYPSRLPQLQTSRPRRSGLADFFGLLD